MSGFANKELSDGTSPDLGPLNLSDGEGGKPCFALRSPKVSTESGVPPMLDLICWSLSVIL